MKLQVMPKIFLYSAIASFAAMGCGDEQPGRDSNGGCNSEYISAKNGLASTVRDLGNYYNDDLTLNAYGRSNPDLVKKTTAKVLSQCDSFLSSYKNTTCKVVDISDGETTQIEGAQIAQGCDMIRNLPQTTSATPSASASSTSTSTEALTSQIMQIPTDSNVETVPAMELQDSAE